MVEKLTTEQAKDFGFDAVSAHRMIAAHDAGDYEDAAALLEDAFCWSAAPWPATARPGPQGYWMAVRDGLTSATPRPHPSAMNIVRQWLGEPTVSQFAPTPPRASPSEPTEDQIATWLAARGMVMIDAEELAALRRNGTGGPPPIDGETFRKITRF